MPAETGSQTLHSFRRLNLLPADEKTDYPARQMIQLTGHDLTLGELQQIAFARSECEIPASARERMAASRALVEKVAAEPRAIYGINTGFGPLSGTRVAAADLERHQLNLLHHLSVGQGSLFSAVETRAIMAARANALARGFSGIRPAVVELLVAALNRGLLPEIPSEGSVGASGDLVPLAHLSQLLIGHGHVRVGEIRRPAAAALAEHGLRPVTLQCKEGLALVNGTSVMTGLAALATREAGELLGWMTLLSAQLVPGAVGVAGGAVRAGPQGARVSRPGGRGGAHGGAFAARIRNTGRTLMSINGVRTPSRWIRAWKSRTRIPCGAPRRFSGRFARRSGTSNRWWNAS